jgi:hypothetical protein
VIIKDKLIEEYPLTKKIELPFECYKVLKRRYVIFCDEEINGNNIESLLDVFYENTKNIFPKKKTLIVIGHTNERFNKKDLLFFNGEDTFIVFYLINENNEIFFNDQKYILNETESLTCSYNGKMPPFNIYTCNQKRKKDNIFGRQRIILLLTYSASSNVV